MTEFKVNGKEWLFCDVCGKREELPFDVPVGLPDGLTIKAFRENRVACVSCRQHLDAIRREITATSEHVVLWAREHAIVMPEYSHERKHVRCPLCMSAGVYSMGLTFPRGLDRHLDRCEVALWIERDVMDIKYAVKPQVERATRQLDAEYWSAGVTRETEASHVYLIANERAGTVKIGISNNPKKRISDLQRASGDTLRLVGTVKTDLAFAMERELHRKFATLRLHGEWFTDAPEVRVTFTEITGYEAAA